MVRCIRWSICQFRVCLGDSVLLCRWMVALWAWSAAIGLSLSSTAFQASPLGTCHTQLSPSPSPTPVLRFISLTPSWKIFPRSFLNHRLNSRSVSEVSFISRIYITLGALGWPSRGLALIECVKVEKPWFPGQLGDCGGGQERSLCCLSWNKPPWS